MKKIFIGIFVLLLLGMLAFLFWPQKKVSFLKKTISFKTALLEAKQLNCEYVSVEGLQTKTYTKNGMLRSDFVDAKDAQNSGGILIRDGKSYVWWTKDKQGLVVSSADDNSEQKDKLISDMEQYNANCKEDVISDILFTVPTDIKFRDPFVKSTPIGESAK